MIGGAPDFPSGAPFLLPGRKTKTRDRSDPTRVFAVEIPIPGFIRTPSARDRQEASQ
jgi:hypothetical protein